MLYISDDLMIIELSLKGAHDLKRKAEMSGCVCPDQTLPCFSVHCVCLDVNTTIKARGECQERFIAANQDTRCDIRKRPNTSLQDT